ncbi:hypothetical protein IKD67_02005 [Candidatus Saccharibacteria bacterium]|nr:hypothetical protein [Candidatus Saccharibacteria bacterium]
MSGIINPSKEFVIAKTALIRLRSGTALYKEELENVLRALGVEYEVPTEDYAKGILISLATNIYGYDERRLTLLMSLGLLADYRFLRITERRVEFAEYCGPGTSTEAIRKREDHLLQHFLTTLQKRIAIKGESLIDDAVADAVNSGALYTTGHDIWRVSLPRVDAS